MNSIDSPSDQEDGYLAHIREASHQASQDFDSTITKLGTAGLTVTLGVAGLTDANSWTLLLLSGVAFAMALVVSLLSIRMSADGLRILASGQKEYPDIRQFAVVRWLNWVSWAILSTAFLLLSLHLPEATVRLNG